VHRTLQRPRRKSSVSTLRTLELPPHLHPPQNGHGHGETKATASVDEGGSVRNEIELVKEAAADVIADLKGASLEDKE